MPPPARPIAGARLFTRGPLRGVGERSVIAAVNAPVAAPAATPCRMRAAINHPAPSATANTIRDTTSRPIDAKTTGLRPR